MVFAPVNPATVGVIDCLLMLSDRIEVRARSALLQKKDLMFGLIREFCHLGV